ncbi:MAG TPA: diguanylate cyclase [Pseudomonadales bacterium]|nr:diguanylate cyclase [Pseudomonadales bacterium]
MKVLVADDSRSLRMLIASTVLQAGHEVIEAEDGVQAVERYRDNEIHLVVMDAEMPHKDGFAATAEIKALGDNAWVPIIFLSGHVENEYIQRALDTGADVYLRKPLNAVELVGQIKAMERIYQMQQELQAVNAVLEGLAHRDGLTHLFNRRSFDERLAVEMGRSYRNHLGMSLIIGDVDCFKPYNDTYGHQAGDACLQAVAKVMGGSFKRATDMVARYGGEEFAIILPETGEEAAYNMSVRMLEAIEALQIAHTGSVVKDVVTMSVGVAHYDGSTKPESAALIELADQALYEAKRSGRNRGVMSSTLVASANTGDRVAESAK